MPTIYSEVTYTDGGGSGTWFGFAATYPDGIAANDSSDVRTDGSVAGYSRGHYYTFTGLPTYCGINWAYVGGGGSNGSGATLTMYLGGQAVQVVTGTGAYTIGGYVYGLSRNAAANIASQCYCAGNGNSNPSTINHMPVTISWDYLPLLSLTANDVTNYAPTSVTLNGQYNANGDGGSQWRLVYKEFTAGSFDAPSYTSAPGQTGTVTCSRNLTGLTPGTTYLYKVQALNSGSVLYESPERSFQTNAGTPAQNNRIREILTRRLWTLRRPRALLEITAPLSILDANVLDRVAVESPIGPTPSGIGWSGGAEWKRRVFSIQRMEIDVHAQVVRLLLLDRRELDVRLYDTGMTSLANLSGLDLERDNGVARLARGAARTYTRTGKSWVANPTDPTKVIECSAATPAITSTGEFFEASRTNYLLRSSGVSGMTGLSTSGTGTNGSAVAADTAVLLFNPESSPSSIKLTAGSPHTVTLAVWLPTSASITANSVCVLSIDHAEDSGAGLYFTMRRNADNYWYNAGSNSWQASEIQNTLSNVTSPNEASRYVSSPFSIGAANSTVLFGVGFLGGGTAGRIGRLFHAQLEVGGYVGTRIISDASSVTRGAATLAYDVTTTAKVYDPTVGTFFAEVIPTWSASQLGGSDKRYVYHMETNGGADYDALYYDRASSAWRFERKVGGSTYIASRAASPVAGTTYRLAARWTSSAGELDLSAYSISVFVDGAKGTDATSAAPTFTSPETLRIGSNGSGASQFDGRIRERRVFPHALLDAEIGRLP
jgi:hypothetical protein